MNGKSMLLLLPFGESMLKSSYPLGRWIDQWDYEIGRYVETLDPEGWVFRGHDHDGGEEHIYGFGNGFPAIQKAAQVVIVRTQVLRLL